MLQHLGVHPARLILLLATCVIAGLAGAAVPDAYAGLPVCEWDYAGCSACIAQGCSDLHEPEDGESPLVDDFWLTGSGECWGECQENFYGLQADVRDCGACIDYQ